MLISPVAQANSTQFIPVFSNIIHHWYFVLICMINEYAKLDQAGLVLGEFYR